MSAVPMLPSQTGTLPNRGRKEARESLRAVQSRESVRHSRTASQIKRSSTYNNSPVRIPSQVAEETLPTQPAESPIAKTPDDKYAPGATLSGPLNDSNPFMVESPQSEAKKEQKIKPNDTPTAAPLPAESKPSENYFQVSPPPTPTKDLTLFLQYKSKVKKIVLPEGRDELSIGRLQLAFIDKFSWNTQQNGADLPEIYIQDPVSGVRHELEDLSDIKDRTVLVLNVEALDEVKRHIDEGMFALTKIVREVKQNVDDQAVTLQRVSDRQQETAKEMAQIVEQAQQAPVRAADEPKTLSLLGAGKKLGSGQIGEVQTLRRDLAVLRQTYSTFQSEIQASMSTIRSKAANVKTVAAKAAIPSMDGDNGYAYVTNGRKQLNADSDRLVAKVDDLQDLVEDLRKDVVHRGVRPLPRQLEVVSKDVTSLSKQLKAMEDYMSKEKPIWTKIWEKELEDVCQGRDELRIMEELLIDLRDDLEKASETFALVEQATKEQMKDAGTGPSASTARTFSKVVNLGNSVNQSAAKEDMLGEVRALQPNHEDRLEAIERAEKLRQKELKNRSDNPLHREIRNFVAEGKLKKSGGFEEIERARVAKDEKIRREVWERMNGLAADEEEEEEEEDEEEEEEEEEEGEEGVQGAEEEVNETAAGSQPGSPKKAESPTVANE